MMGPLEVNDRWLIPQALIPPVLIPPVLISRVLIPQRVRYSEMTDLELVRACQTHNIEAFNWLVRRYEPIVFGILYKLAPELPDPADLVQDVFLRLWSSLGSLKNPHAFKSWLKRIVTNRFYDYLRRRPKQVILSIDNPIEAYDSDDGMARQIADPSALPDVLIERHETSEVIQAAMTKLSRLSKTMIELREDDGLSYIEIAAITKCPLGTVKSRIARARTRLQSILLPYVRAS